MTGLEFMYIIIFIVLTSIFFSKMLNVMTIGKLYGKTLSWTGFALFIWLYGVGTALTFVNPLSAGLDSLFTSTTWRWITVLLILTLVMQVFEVLYILKEIVTNRRFSSEEVPWYKN